MIMNNNDPDKNQATEFSGSKLHLFISAAAFLGILFLAGYIGSQFQEMEDQLRYRAPASISGESSRKINLEKGQTVYVPAYSHIYSGEGEPQLLAITLSIRNTDPDRSIRIIEARYFDSKGELVKNYVDGIFEVAPLQTIDVLVGKQDKRGGSGANFIVTWKSDEAVYEPIIEAVMIGVAKDQNISFISPARPLAKRVK